MYVSRNVCIYMLEFHLTCNIMRPKDVKTLYMILCLTIPGRRHHLVWFATSVALQLWKGLCWCLIQHTQIINFIPQSSRWNSGTVGTPVSLRTARHHLLEHWRPGTSTTTSKSMSAKLRSWWWVTGSSRVEDTPLSTGQRWSQQLQVQSTVSCQSTLLRISQQDNGSSSELASSFNLLFLLRLSYSGWSLRPKDFTAVIECPIYGLRGGQN